MSLDLYIKLVDPLLVQGSVCRKRKKKNKNSNLATVFKNKPTATSSSRFERLA